MNPFLSFLILVPLLVSLVLCAGLLLLLWHKGPRLGIAIPLLLISGISVYLLLVFKKTFSPKDAEFAIPGSEILNEADRKSLTSFYLILTYLVLGFCGLLLFNYDSMRGWVGMLGFLMGITLLWSGIMMARSETAITRSAYFRINRSLYPRRKRVFFILAVSIGFVILLQYRFAPWWKTISTWDISGILFLLASACVWLVLSDMKVIKSKN